MTVPVTLLYELGSPYSYLAAERIERVLGQPVTFAPILLGAIFGLRGSGSWSLTPAREEGMAECEARAARYGLPPIVWPEGWPNTTLWAMRAAVVAHDLGRGREFAMEAFRAAFVRGEDLSSLVVLDRVATAARLDAVRVVEELNNPRIKQRLADLTQAAWDGGVRGAPTVIAAGRVYYGDDQLEAVATALRPDGT